MTMDANETQIAYDSPGWGKTPHLQASRKSLPRSVGCKKNDQSSVTQISKNVKRMLQHTNLTNVSTTGQQKFRQMHFLGRLDSCPTLPYQSYVRVRSRIHGHKSDL